MERQKSGELHALTSRFKCLDGLQGWFLQGEAVMDWWCRLYLVRFVERKRSLTPTRRPRFSNRCCSVDAYRDITSAYRGRTKPWKWWSCSFLLFGPLFIFMDFQRPLPKDLISSIFCYSNTWMVIVRELQTRYKKDMWEHCSNVKKKINHIRAVPRVAELSPKVSTDNDGHARHKRVVLLKEWVSIKIEWSREGRQKFKKTYNSEDSLCLLYTSPSPRD